VLARYSVSDAVATYYLYMKYVHLFIYSLCVIIPMPPNDVLRKGSGTLCEMLLMVQAYENNVIAPNKQLTQHEKFYQGHLLESETYVGGHVACLESGIFRTDIPVHFSLNSTKLQSLIDEVDTVLKFAVEVESEASLDTIVNLDEVRKDIVDKLTYLRDNPVGKQKPLIYHLDVGAMYPNIILTNRLQPYAMVEPHNCAACDYNAPDAQCQRKLKWMWRGKWYLPKHGEVAQLRQSLEMNYRQEEGSRARTFNDLPMVEQAAR
jgi:DNA polymerase epsilon subunit 1